MVFEMFATKSPHLKHLKTGFSVGKKNRSAEGLTGHDRSCSLQRQAFYMKVIA